MTLRQIVFRIYAALFVALAALAMICAFSVALRLEVFPFFEAVWSSAPKIAEGVRKDPLYLLAALLVTPLLWCLPWKIILDGRVYYRPTPPVQQSDSEGEDIETDLNDLRRGRPLMSSSAANRKAFRQIAREIASEQRADRNQRRSFRVGGD